MDIYEIKVRKLLGEIANIENIAGNEDLREAGRIRLVL
jgi:hypothetical protein